MRHEKIYFRPDDPSVYMATYISEDEPVLEMPPRPALVIFPGGAYINCTPRESEPIMKHFFAAGFNVFILYYSLGEKAKFPRPLEEASMAVAHVRSHAQEYNIDPARIFVIGFSAGAHLAASLSTMWHRPEAAFYGMTPGANRPDGSILSYGCLSVDTGANLGLFERVYGGKGTIDELRACSPADHVDERTCPSYIWHTFGDTGVTVLHSLHYANKMAAAKVPFEMHIFQNGVHGLSLANKQTWRNNPALICPEVEQWIDEAIAWALRLETTAE